MHVCIIKNISMSVMNTQFSKSGEFMLRDALILCCSLHRDIESHKRKNMQRTKSMNLKNISSCYLKNDTMNRNNRDSP